ncbi:MAG: Gfo/Idh/MocA family oxidoreductase [Geminicoccaceae bacterium]
MKRLNVGLIGSGFIGRAHAFAWRMAPAVFDLPLQASLQLLADVDQATAERQAARLGIPAATGDWQGLISNPDIDLIDITTPNSFHEPMALAAIAAKKPVYCEKPLAPNAATALKMAEAAEAAGVPTFVGFNYIKAPMAQYAREIAQSGEIGELWGFRGIHAEDYMTDPNGPWTWRLDPKGGAGAVADLGSHIVSLARFVVGEIDAVCADLDTCVKDRPVAPGASERRPVEVDDQARALVRFANGCKGTIEASWVATGRTMHLAFELYGSKGSILLDMERMNELRLHVRKGGPANGYLTVPAGPAHPDYAPFCPAPGHQLGFNDVKTIEVKTVVECLAAGRRFYPDFREAYAIQRVVDAILSSARERRWVDVREI